MSAQITPMSVETTAIDGLVRITTKAASDERGTVREFFRATAFADAGIPVPERWEQVNVTHTQRGAIRGLHGEATDKLIGVAAGTAYGAWLDARRDSPTWGQVVTAELTVGTQLLVPAGVCNGFQATSDDGCTYVYCFSAEWRSDMAGVGVNPLDDELGIAWPIAPDPTDPSSVSSKDASAPNFREL